MGPHEGVHVTRIAYYIQVYDGLFKDATHNHIFSSIFFHA